MKRLTLIATMFSVSLLAVWAIFQAYTASQPKDQSAHNEAVVPVTGPENRKIAPVFDGSGAVVSDPSGILLGTDNSGQLAAPVPGSNLNIAPVFDSSGAIVSDPSGTILNAMPLEVKIAPVFDANGNLISDPSGTISNAPNP